MPALKKQTHYGSTDAIKIRSLFYYRFVVAIAPASLGWLVNVVM